MMLTSVIFIASLTVCSTVLAQNPVPRVGNDCPYGTYRSGDYCIPNRKADGSTDSYIVKSGNNCPYGYRASGDYCVKAAGDKPESIPRESGKDCPYGWYKSGNTSGKVSDLPKHGTEQPARYKSLMD